MSQPLQQRHTVRYNIHPQQAAELKTRILNWASRFSIHIFLDSNNYSSVHDRYQCLLAAGAVSTLSTPDLNALHELYVQHKDWLFGHISYDLKDQLFNGLGSKHGTEELFPLMHFFVPATVCYINSDSSVLTIESFDDPEAVYAELLSAEHEQRPLPRLSFKSLFGKDDYLATIDGIRTHIKDGDCYEVNFCSKGYCDGIAIDPLTVYKALNTLSPAPFSAYYRLNDSYMMCASPERYLMKNGPQVISQPIKGTARRSKDPEEDDAIKDALYNSIKERAENVMIVDLVRNDLARSCKVGSVQVNELFGIYSYPQVHQMISTISGTLQEGIPFTQAIANSFPMGSMTGAPKYKVMQLIDRYERSARGLFSGSVGYLSPTGNFDFNVVIRSLFYNSATQHLHYLAGGAITYDSVPEQEWEEMRLKAWAMERIFS